MINFSINKAYFLQALNTTKRAISSKNAIPISVSYTHLTLPTKA